MPRNLFLKRNYKWNRHKKRDNPEGIVQLRIIHYLKALGATVGKTKTLGVKRGKFYCLDPYVMKGKADLECFHKGIMYAIECKAPGKKIKKDSDQDLYRSLFHSPPSRIFIEADCLEDVQEIIG